MEKLLKQLPLRFMNERTPIWLTQLGNHGAILASPVAVEDAPWLRTFSSPNHCHGIFNQAGLHVGLQTPADNLTTEHINDSSQVQPTFIGSVIGDMSPHRS